MKKLLTIVLIVASLTGLTACSENAAEAAGTVTEAPANTPTAEPTIAPSKTPTETPTAKPTIVPTETPTAIPTAAPLEKSTGLIYLYGEAHGVEAILNKELELWSGHYHNEGLRHLFIEYPYYTAELLNLWMKTDGDDTILNEIYYDWAGTAAHVPAVKEFYIKVKANCPETIFHGTDVGHQYKTTGMRYLGYLQTEGLEDSESYSLALEAIEQGKTFYSKQDGVYRENKMAENFIREFDKLIDENVMGIYGNAHAAPDGMAYNSQSVPNMANQLYQRYGDSVSTEDLTWIMLDIDPIRTDTITVNGKDYEALYFGAADMSNWSKEYKKREYWRLENAYDDFKDSSKNGQVLPYDNYVMLIAEGQVFVIDYTKTDGTVVRKYYRSDGDVWQGLTSTVEFLP